MKEEKEDGLISLETLIKAHYMMAALKPDGESSYVIFLEPDDITFEYHDKTVNSIKVGQILNVRDNYVPWDRITAKTERLTNVRLFRIMIFNYINKIIANIWKEHFPESDCEVDTFSVDKATAFLNEYDNFALAFGIEEFCNSTQEVQEFFETFDKHEYSPLFKNPACLVLFYVIKKHQHTIIQNWNFSDNEIKELLNIMNISSDVL